MTISRQAPVIDRDTLHRDSDFAILMSNPSEGVSYDIIISQWLLLYDVWTTIYHYILPVGKFICKDYFVIFCTLVLMFISRTISTLSHSATRSFLLSIFSQLSQFSTSHIRRNIFSKIVWSGAKTSATNDRHPDPSKSLPLSKERQALIGDIIALYSCQPTVERVKRYTPDCVYDDQVCPQWYCLHLATLNIFSLCMPKTGMLSKGPNKLVGLLHSPRNSMALVVANIDTDI